MEDAFIPLIVFGAIIMAIYYGFLFIIWILSWIWYGLYIAALSIFSFVDSYQIFFYGASSLLMVFACIWLVQGSIQSTQIDNKNKQLKDERDRKNKRQQDITDSFNKNLESLKKKVK